MPAMRLLSYGAVTLMLVVLLVAVQPKAALVLAVLLGGSYGLIYLGVRNRLARLGEARFEANHQRFQAAGDVVGGIKDVKILGLEETYLRRFQKPALALAEYDATSAVISEFPRHILEAIGFGGMLLFVLVMLATDEGSLGAVLPVLGVYAFAGLRLFPALQQVYGSFAALRFARPTLDKLHADLAATSGGTPLREGAGTPPLRLEDRLELAAIEYAYPQAERAALRGVDMTIPARTTVGLVGGTGAGKTTVVDLILGLLEPQAGTILVDGAAGHRGEPPRLAAGDRLRAAGDLPDRRVGRVEHRLRPAARGDRPGRGRARRADRRAARLRDAPSCRRATTRRSASAGCGSRAASASASASPARSTTTRTC